MGSHKKYLIYALAEPGTIEIRYVGKSSFSDKRARVHWQPSVLKKGLFYVDRWVRKVRSAGKFPEVIILEEFDFMPNIGQILNDAEIKYIKLFRESGFNLTNVTDGGDGATGWKPSNHDR